MKKVLTVILSIFMLTSVVIATSIFAWYRANTSPKANVEQVTTVTKTVDVTIRVKGDVVNKEKIDKDAFTKYNAKTIAPEKGFYPIVPKAAGKFLYNEESAVWQMGANNGVREITSKEVDGTIGAGKRAFSQMDNITFEAISNTDRIFYPTITIADNEFSNGLSCALFAVDVDHPEQYELVAYSDYYFGYSPVSERSSKALANTNAFVIQKNRTIQLTLLTWLDASKANAVNIYREGLVSVDLNNYDNIVFDSEGKPYREHYTDGFEYKKPEGTDATSVPIKNTGLNSFLSNYTVNADQTEVEHDENGNIIKNADGTTSNITRIPSYYLHTDGTAYPVVILKGEVGNVRRLTIPQSVTSFPKFGANTKNYLEELILDGEFNISNDAFKDWTNLKKVYIGPKMLAIGDNAFYGCTGIKEITMEGGTSLGKYVFRFTTFEEISIPSTIQSMGSFVLRENDGLRHAFVNMKIVGRQMFSYCDTLESIIFGPNVEKIDAQVTEYCKNIKSIIIGDNVTTVGEGGSAFAHCTAVTDIVVGRKATNIYSTSFQAMKDTLKNITMPGDVAALIMGDKTAVQNVTITTGAIPANAFSGKTTINTVTIQGGVTSIGADAFKGCTGITRLNVLELGNWCKTTFGNANSNPLSQGATLYIDNKVAEDLVIPSKDAANNDLTAISDYAFYNCDTIKSLTIPQSITSIDTIANNGANAFTGCDFISNIVTTTNVIKNLPLGALESLEIADQIVEVEGEKDTTPSAISEAITITAANLKTLKIGAKVDATNADFSHCEGLTKAIVPATVLAKLPSTVTDLTVLSGNITSVPNGLTNLRIEETASVNVGANFSNASIVSLAVTADDLKNITFKVDSVKHLEIINTLSNTVEVQAAGDSTSVGETETQIRETPVSHSDIEKFTALESIQIGDYTTIDGTVDTSKLPNLTKAIVSGSKIGEMLRATNTGTQSKITELEVVSGTIEQKGGSVLMTGLSYWHGSTFKATLTIKDGVIVEDGAFTGCLVEIETATIPANAINPMLNYDYKLSTDSLKYVTITSGTIPDNAFDNAPNITSLSVGDGVTGVGESAFDKITANIFNKDSTNYSNTDAALSYQNENVKYLGNTGNPYHIAVGVTGNDVTSIRLHDDCKYVAEYAFAGTLDGNVYSGLAGLTKVYIPSTTRLTENAFLGRVNNITAMTAPATALAAIPRYDDTTTSQYDEINTKLEKLTVNGGAIPRQSLANFRVLETVTLENEVITINDLVFENCTALDEVTIKNPRINIASNAFEGCVNIHKATIPASVIEYIPKNELVDVNITSGEIGEYAFENAPLVKVTLGAEVTAVKHHAFEGCNTVAVLINNSGITTNLPTHKATSGDIQIAYGGENDGIVTYNNIIMRYVGNGGSYKVANTITEISQYAFYNRDKIDIDFSEATNLTTIGDYAFYGCESIRKLDLPNKTTKIGNYAFYSCSNLYFAKMLGVANTANIGNNAFLNCGILISVQAHSTIGTKTSTYDPYEHPSHLFDKVPKNADGNPISGDQVTPIDNADGKYITYTVGTGTSSYKVLLSYYGNADKFYMTTDDLYVKEISPYAFDNRDNLTEVIIAPTVEKIGDSAFLGCDNLKTVTFRELTPAGDSELARIKEIGKAAFKGCVNLTSIDILDTVEIIGEEAFADCVNLTTINFETGSKLKTINARAFMRSGVTNVVIPDSVENVGDAAFYRCENLNSITIGSAVKTIGDACFFACYNLVTVEFKGTAITQIGSTCTIDPIGGTETSSTGLKGGVFDDCIRLTTITLPTSVTKIGDYAFDGCLSLSEITATGVTSVGKYAFHNCEDLTQAKITFSASVSADKDAYLGCDGLEGGAS